jgi:hypothetical protein
MLSLTSDWVEIKTPTRRIFLVQEDAYTHMTAHLGAKSVSDLIRAQDDDGLHARFQEVMESHDIARMATLTQEFIVAHKEFGENTDDTACLENAMELLRAIAQITTAEALRTAIRTKAAFVEEIKVMDPGTGNAVGVSMYKTAGGGMVGIDSSFLEQAVGKAYSPFDEGVELELDDEKEANYPAWIVDQLEHHSTEAFTLWLEHHQVDTYTDDVKSRDEYEQHGFPLPERQADTVWILPQSDDYPTGSIEIRWWQEEDVLLGYSERTDTVMCLDYMRWYHIPIAAIQEYLRSSDEGKRATA